MTTSESVANYFIKKAQEAQCTDLTQMKLQKLVYYAYGWYLGLSGSKLFAEPIQAWRYGPVVESLRGEFRDFGRDPITRPAQDIVYQDGHFVDVTPSIDDPHLADFLDRIWEVYGGYSPFQLSNLTHAPDTPWSRVADRYGPDGIPPGITIPDELIQEHFAACAKVGVPA